MADCRTHLEEYPVSKGYKRVNIMILDEQYRELSNRELNISGVIRDLLGDYLSRHTITVQVTEETRRLYDTIIANTGATDEDIEVHLRAALARVLDDRIAQMQALRQRLVDDGGAS
jgi:hypothetical protein